MVESNATQAGTDASLKSLETDAGKLVPGFWASRTNYMVALPSSRLNVRIKAAANDAAAVVRVAGKVVREGEWSEPVDVPIGRGVVAVEVTAADGKAVKRYEFKTMRNQPNPDWVRVLEHAPFSNRDSEGEAVFNGKMWVLGGYTPGLVRDVWTTSDGVAWDRMADLPDESGVNIPICVVHDNRLFVSSQSGIFYSTTDGKSWAMVTDSAPWRGRYGAGAAVFKGRIWVVGGFKDGGLMNDVWSSADGKTWREEVTQAPWSPRQVFSNLVVHGDKMYLVGGGVSVYQPFRSYRDVWCTSDGVNWERVAEQAPWCGRIWTSCVSYRGAIWLIGGFEAMPRWKNFNDVWYSRDGKTWRQLETENIWSERHEVSALVQGGKLWVIAGNAWPLMNDVWSLDIRGLTFVTQPVIEEFARCEYRYAAHADFAAGETPVRYRLRSGPSWLSVNATTGEVTGRAGEIGDYAVEIEATAGPGETATQKWTLHVISAAN